MDNDFQLNYLQILSDQVADEIKFLQSYNHGTKQNYQCCPFCYDDKSGTFNCNRLHELRRFQSSIAVDIQQRVNPNRRSIVFESKAVDLTHIELPPLLQPF